MISKLLCMWGWFSNLITNDMIILSISSEIFWEKSMDIWISKQIVFWSRVTLICQKNSSDYAMSISRNLGRSIFIKVLISPIVFFDSWFRWAACGSGFFTLEDVCHFSIACKRRRKKKMLSNLNIFPFTIWRVFSMLGLDFHLELSAAIAQSLT